MSVICNSGNEKLDIAVRSWFKHDKNPATIAEVEDDIKNSRWEKLEKVMLGRLKFGTAGLRGPMAAGYKCMNDVVVLQTAQGLCSYIKKECNQEQINNGIVVGYDGRHNSKRFAELTAKVFATAGVPVRLFSRVCPTPLVSFGTVLHRGAGGVMVTASHNPKEDNGYKVYWSNGSQIIAPDDDNILEEIWLNRDIPADHWSISDIRAHPLVTDCTDEVSAKYFEYIRESLSEDVLSCNARAGVLCVYSAMHGVGWEYIVKAFEAANLKCPISVAEQQAPDPDFPTVAFPNPEEPACLELSRRLGAARGARLALVNDPDADRLAVAERAPDTKTWKVFTGNEMGALLGWWVLLQRGGEPGYCISSVVSSRLLRAIAEAEGHMFVETLTGFKWMGNTTLLLQAEGKRPLFAYEEAIGYMVHPRVPDKDGVSAAVQVASLASNLYSKGSSLAEQLQELYKKYGYHVSHNGYYLCHDPAVIRRIFRRIRNYAGPGEYPKSVGPVQVTGVHDLAAGVRAPADARAHRLSVIGTGLDKEYKGGEMVSFTCAGGLRLTVRTSGTEPKVKYYSEVAAAAGTVLEQEKIKKELVATVQAFVEELLQPKQNGLIG